MIRSEKWNVTKSLAIGAVIGFIYNLILIFVDDLTWMPLFNIVARTVGGAVGGAFLFGIVTVIRNAFVK